MTIEAGSQNYDYVEKEHLPSDLPPPRPKIELAISLVNLHANYTAKDVAELFGLNESDAELLKLIEEKGTEI